MQNSPSDTSKETSFKTSVGPKCFDNRETDNEPIVTSEGEFFLSAHGRLLRQMALGALTRLADDQD